MFPSPHYYGTIKLESVRCSWMHKWVMFSLMEASAPTRTIFALCVGCSASCELHHLFFGIRNRVPLCIVFLLILDWHHSLCFYNSLGSTPMCPWICWYRITPHCWLWVFSSSLILSSRMRPACQFHYLQSCIPETGLSFCPSLPYFQTHSLGQPDAAIMSHFSHCLP